MATARKPVFNGELKITIPVTNRQPGEPDAFAIVMNPKARGGLIPYARYGETWTANPVPTRPLIRTLVDALDAYAAALKAEREKK